MHTVVFADGARDAKNARESSLKLFLKGAWSEQRANRRSSGATRASKSDKNGSDEHRLGGQESEFFDAKCLKSVFRNVLATEGGKHIFEKI